MDKIRLRDFGAISIEHKKTATGVSMHSFHMHHSYEIFFSAKGCKAFLLRDSYHELEEGDIMLLAPNEPHRAMDNQAYEWFCINLSDEFFDTFFAKVSKEKLLELFKKRIIHPSSDQLSTLYEKFAHCCKSYRENDEMLFVSIADLLFYLSHLPLRLSRKNPHGLISEITEYLSENYSDNISLSHLEKKYHISGSGIYQLFKSELGTTPTKFINNLRVLQACSLLLGTRLSITHIAMNLGFSSASHFGNVFKAITGQTPSAFRNSKRNQRLI